ncbi:MAG: IS1595 family transposase [Deltaproteobacteria bacterium]|nr:IS1595 family transposase [Deltaproteobacteria bacterium]MBW1818128.1 IS1595 family transposase [Deltaproteobacteria bacterium]MBW2285717.1 IS1595 family transposase [Deltaproteobacteria bacterium]
MENEQLDLLISDEERAREYLVEKCFGNRERFCPRCQCTKLYKLGDDRFRCSCCKYTFHDFSGRWINHGRFTPVQWLLLARYFEKGLPVLKIASAMSYSYGTVYEAVRIIRLSIAAAGDDAAYLLPQGFADREGRFRRRPDGYRDIPVFGIGWEEDIVRAVILPQFSAENIIGLSARMDRFGSIVFVGDIMGFEGLIFFEPRHLRRYRVVPFAYDRDLGEETGTFWSWAKGELVKYHGISYENFPLYLKELEFRFNHKSQDFIEDLMDGLCRLKPRAGGLDAGAAPDSLDAAEA